MTSEELNTVVVEYAMSVMDERTLSSEAFQHVKGLYHNKLNIAATRSNAVIRTQGLSNAYVVASCGEDGRDTVYSDYSGKKGRPTVLADFPHRKPVFREWYHDEQKPYQHRMLYDEINDRLGTIGSFRAGVNHPIGYCAEQNVANRLLLDKDAGIGDIKFSVAIRPRTEEVVESCDNCKTLFQQLRDEED